MRIAEAFAGGLLEAAEILGDFLLQARGHFAIAQELDAAVAGDRESRRNGNAEIRHLGEVGTLAAEDLLHVLRPFGAASAEEVDMLATRCRRRGRGGCRLLGGRNAHWAWYAWLKSRIGTITRVARIVCRKAKSNCEPQRAEKNCLCH